jgi:small subunit ribosomal protein S6e
LLQSKAEAQAYHKLLVSRLKEQRERRSESLAKKRAIRQASQVG